MDILTGLGLAIPAGLNAYIPLLTVAVAERLGWIDLGEPYALLGEWWAIVLIAVLLLVEVIADKVPAVDSANDAVQTFLRPAAGGLLFVAATGDGDWLHPAVWVVAGVLVAGSVHAVKATSRPAVHATTGGAAGPLVSLAEDIAAFIATVVALVAPVLVALIVIAGVAVLVRQRWRVRAER